MAAIVIFFVAVLPSLLHTILNPPTELDDPVTILNVTKEVYDHTGLLTCPNPWSLSTRSLNSPNQIVVSEIDDGTCAQQQQGTRRTSFQGDLNLKIRGHTPIGALRRTPDHIPGQRANLTNTECRSRDAFIKSYRKHKRKVKPSGKLLDQFAAKLDTVLFSGSLTSGPEPILLPIETAWTEIPWPEENILVEGLKTLDSCSGDDHIRMILSLNAGRYHSAPEALTFEEILLKLVHEIAHAFTLVIACHCPTCMRHLHPSVGHYSHGQAWDEITFHMLGVMKG